jgi:hypothetical protein
MVNAAAQGIHGGITQSARGEQGACSQARRTVEVHVVIASAIGKDFVAEIRAVKRRMRSGGKENNSQDVHHLK